MSTQGYNTRRNTSVEETKDIDQTGWIGAETDDPYDTEITDVPMTDTVQVTDVFDSIPRIHETASGSLAQVLATHYDVQDLTADAEKVEKLEFWLTAVKT